MSLNIHYTHHHKHRIDFYFVIFVLIGSSGGPYEKELLNILFKNYNPQNRPVLNESSPITITFGVTLQQIVDLVSVR